MQKRDEPAIVSHSDSICSKSGAQRFSQVALIDGHYQAICWSEVAWLWGHSVAYPVGSVEGRGLEDLCVWISVRASVHSAFSVCIVGSRYVWWIFGIVRLVRPVHSARLRKEHWLDDNRWWMVTVARVLECLLNATISKLKKSGKH